MNSMKTDLTDELPNFDENFRTQIERHLNKLKSFNGRVCEEDWKILKRVLLDYKQKVTHWNGYLQVGEQRLVQTATKTAGKLQKQIEGLIDKGIAWPFRNKLTPEDMFALMESLKVLAEVEMGSQKNKGPLPGLRSNAMEKAAVDLQKEVDHWYLRLTGLNPSMEDEGLSKSHYSYFFKYVISGLHTKLRPGISLSAVHDRRGYMSRLQKKEQNQLEQWQRAARALKNIPK